MDVLKLIAVGVLLYGIGSMGIYAKSEYPCRIGSAVEYSC